MRMFFKSLERRHKIPVHVDEGPEFPEQPGDKPNTFYVTVLREPVARSLSQYKFDQRWDCPRQLRKMPSGNFKPSLENIYTTLLEFVRNPSREHPDIRGPLWICSSNCYARWATGILFPHESNVTESALLEKTRNVLSMYNLILVQEWMREPSYREAISKIFQTHLPEREFFAECARQSRKANKLVPLDLKNHSENALALQQLKDNNRVDSQIFEELIVACDSSFLNTSSVEPLVYKKKQ